MSSYIFPAPDDQELRSSALKHLVYLYLTYSQGMAGTTQKEQARYEGIAFGKMEGLSEGIATLLLFESHAAMPLFDSIEMVNRWEVGKVLDVIRNEYKSEREQSQRNILIMNAVSAVRELSVPQNLWDAHEHLRTEKLLAGEIAPESEGERKLLVDRANELRAEADRVATLAGDR